MFFIRNIVLYVIINFEFESHKIKAMLSHNVACNRFMQLQVDSLCRTVLKTRGLITKKNLKIILRCDNNLR